MHSGKMQESRGMSISISIYKIKCIIYLITLVYVSICDF